MNLCIDQGNSGVKLAVFDGDTLLFSDRYDSLKIQDMQVVFNRYHIRAGILSSVTDTEEPVLDFLRQSCRQFINLTDQTKVPVEVAYKTPESLGKDRLAAVVGAAFLLPRTDILVIDAGTAITYDLIDSEGVYHGGNIAPGIEMRAKSLHHYTSKLPLVEIDPDCPLLGTDTRSAIAAGVLYGVVLEIDGYIDRLLLKYPKLSAFLTGGSLNYFDKKLKNRIFADKNLVLTGLNRILQYNVF